MAQGKFTDLTGQRFGRLVALQRGQSNGKGATWHCQCDCGTYTVKSAKHLVQKSVRSCGCLMRDLNRAKFSNPETLQRLRDAMVESWADGKRGQARQQKAAAKPLPASERESRLSSAFRELDAAWTSGRSS